MAKVLLVSTVSRQFHLFERSNIDVLASMGHEVHAAANYSDASPRLDALPIVRHHIDAERSPLSPRNVRALVQLVKLIRDERIEAIHCHSPVGGVLGRIAGRLTGVRPVIYTAHGFHFHRGAPASAWLLYYPVERMLARWTDVLITINEEDSRRAQGFRARRVLRVPGVGIDTELVPSLPAEIRSATRDELGVSGDDILIVSVGELNANKNHQMVIRAMAEVGDPRLRYVICGQGPMRDGLLKLARELGIEDRLSLLDYRDDVPEILRAADVFAHPSRREGLPVALLEAMSAGLPCIVSDTRGNSELIENGRGGIRVGASDQAALARGLEYMLDPDVRLRLGNHNLDAVGAYDVRAVESAMWHLYSEATRADGTGSDLPGMAGSTGVWIPTTGGGSRV